jgi:hypothetical protein
MNSLERFFDKIFAGWLPGLPANAKDWAAKILPWLLIVLAALGLLSWLSVAGHFGAAALGSTGIHYAYPAFAAVVFNILVPVQFVLAITGGYYMLRRRRLGWRLAFYALLLGLLVNLVWFSMAGLVWSLIFAYLLFQVKPYFRQG